MEGADYIASVADTLSDLTGERGLGTKIADDISDCFRLDLLQELGAVEALDVAEVTTVFRILGRDSWDDARILHKALQKVQQIQMRDESRNYRVSFARTFGESNGWSILLRGMKRHPSHAGIQREAARFFNHIFRVRNSHYVYCEDPEAIEIASCLVAAMRNHPEYSGIQKFAFFALNEIAKENGELGRRPVIASIALSGGIPAIFAVLKKFGVATDSNTTVQELDLHLFRRLTTRLLQKILENDQRSRRIFFHYARDHPDWRETIQAALNAMEAGNGVVDETWDTTHCYDILATLDEF